MSADGVPLARYAHRNKKSQMSATALKTKTATSMQLAFFSTALTSGVRRTRKIGKEAGGGQRIVSGVISAALCVWIRFKRFVEVP